jgi:triosephosphate isomerase
MKYVVANWKMNLGIRESVALARGVVRVLRGREIAPEVILCPALTALSEVHKVLARTRVHQGAQNVAPAESGAWTGEVSVAMLEDVGCQFVIIGHSERRELLGETDQLIKQKVSTVLTSRLTPIVCVGETKLQHDANQAREVVASQLRHALEGNELSGRRVIYLAYEPVWAIGTGTAATIGEVVAMHGFIREVAKQILQARDEQIVVLYGGSVDGENVHGFLRESEVDGVLCGGASLKPAQFQEIVTAAAEIIEVQS